ncbi:MAG TPA: restriction endonuclease subunit S [Acidimicrobiales bacterium]
MWPEVLLDSIATRGSGHTPSKSRASYWGGPIKWLSLKDTFRLDRGEVRETTDSITKDGLDNSSAVMHTKGTVVLLRDAGIGKSAVLGINAAVSQHFMAWKCGASLDPWYLYFVLQSRKSEFERISNGSTIKTIGLDYFRQLTIPLPPIDEQLRLAQALRDADDLISAIETLIRKKRDLRRGTMQQLLTGTTRLPGFTETWTVRKIGDFCQVKSGGTPSTGIARYWGGSVRWMNSGEIHLKRVQEVQGRITVDGLRESPTQLLPEGTVLMALAGQGKTRGTVAISRVALSTNQSIAGILPSPEHDSDFLYYNLDARYEELRGESSGDGGRGGLNLTIIKNLEIDLPSLSEQKAIATVLSDSDDEIDVFTLRLIKARDIRQGMMQELISSRIRILAEAGA